MSKNFKKIIVTLFWLVVFILCYRLNPEITLTAVIAFYVGVVVSGYGKKRKDSEDEEPGEDGHNFSSNSPLDVLSIGTSWPTRGDFWLWIVIIGILVFNKLLTGHWLSF